MELDLQIYTRTAEEAFTEDRSARQNLKVDFWPVAFEITSVEHTAPIVELRFDFNDSPAIFLLRKLEVREAGGAILYDWSGDTEVLNMGSQVRATPWGGGAVVVCEGQDSCCFLPLPAANTCRSLIVSGELAAAFYGDQADAETPDVAGLLHNHRILIAAIRAMAADIRRSSDDALIEQESLHHAIQGVKNAPLVLERRIAELQKAAEEDARGRKVELQRLDDTLRGMADEEARAQSPLTTGVEQLRMALAQVGTERAVAEAALAARVDRHFEAARRQAEERSRMDVRALELTQQHAFAAFQASLSSELGRIATHLDRTLAVARPYWEGAAAEKAQAEAIIGARVDDLSALVARVQFLEAAATAATARANAIETSTSWRVTRALRFAKRLVSGGK